MGKSHVIMLTIVNNSGYDMTYVSDWFDSGRLADGNSWPSTIRNGDTAIVECYEKDWSLAGCSGYVQYSANNQQVAIGFSNPDVGTNKLGFGANGSSVWDSMSSHDYVPFNENINTMLTAFESCTGSSVNNAYVHITPYANFPASSKDHIINLAIFNNTGYDMVYSSDWFDSGRLGDNQSWPTTIAKGSIATVQCYEKDWAVTGCSGYVVYTAGGQNIAIAFSNPLVGVNKLGVGSDGKSTWDNMDNHSYNPFTQIVSTKIMSFCSCTGSKINFALSCITLNLNSWMSNIADSAALNTLSIPGTHDSEATFVYGTFSRCQFYSIDKQLPLGIRFVDLRCDVFNGALYLYHGIIPQFIALSTVLDNIVSFLNANPTETVIVCIKNEGSTPATDFYNLFYNSYYTNTAYEPFFYGTNSIPLMSQVRKKMVLMRRFGTGSSTNPAVGIDASNDWKDNNALFTLNNGVPITIQDLYNPATNQDKENAIQYLINNQGSYSANMVMNFSSGYQGTASPNGPENLANIINPWLNGYLKTLAPQRLGIVPMDFPIYELNILPNYTSALIPRIIKSNGI